MQCPHTTPVTQPRVRYIHTNSVLDTSVLNRNLVCRSVGRSVCRSVQGCTLAKRLTGSGCHLGRVGRGMGVLDGGPRASTEVVVFGRGGDAARAQITLVFLDATITGHQVNHLCRNVRVICPTSCSLPPSQRHAPVCVLSQTRQATSHRGVYQLRRACFLILWSGDIEHFTCRFTDCFKHY